MERRYVVRALLAKSVSSHTQERSQPRRVSDPQPCLPRPRKRGALHGLRLMLARLRGGGTRIRRRSAYRCRRSTKRRLCRTGSDPSRRPAQSSLDRRERTVYDRNVGQSKQAAPKVTTAANTNKGTINSIIQLSMDFLGRDSGSRTGKTCCGARLPLQFSVVPNAIHRVHLLPPGCCSDG